MKIAFKTFGCKANRVDTDSLYLEAVRRGFEVVDESQPADAYVINSCTVTSHADRDARWQVSKFKRLNPGALVGVIGCYAQVAKEEILALSDVDYVVGTADKVTILDAFTSHLAGERLRRDQVQAPTGFLTKTFRGSRYSRASIKIQDGCNFKCSFCIIPEARGRSRSLSVENVLKQLEEANDLGFKEVTLTGIHLAHYGWERGTNLFDLLKEIIKNPSGPRIRVSTLDPFEIPDELIELMASSPRICPHYHIALQSGSDDVLKGMRRIYKAHEFVDVTNKIQRRNPDTFIGVDVIVGFPGEGEKEFQETVKCLEDSAWTKLHVFPFSERKGTRAETLPGKVPSKVSVERSRILREMSEARYHAFLTAQIGKPREVLVEKLHPKLANTWLGHTENYIPTLSKLERAESKHIFPSIVRSVERDRVWTTTA